MWIVDGIFKGHCLFWMVFLLFVFKILKLIYDRLPSWFCPPSEIYLNKKVCSHLHAKLYVEVLGFVLCSPWYQHLNFLSCLVYGREEPTEPFFFLEVDSKGKVSPKGRSTWFIVHSRPVVFGLIFRYLTTFGR